jgi:KamA family protein
MGWEEEFGKNIISIDQLGEIADLTPADRRRLRSVTERHPMSITRYYASLIDWSDPADPLRRMVVPDTGELDTSGAYDQSGEKLNTRMQGLQHKYERTVLLLTTNICTSFCRYCFRKRLVGLPSHEIMSRFTDALRYIRAHREVNNVLLSGGDPLALPTHMIRRFLEGLSSVRHLDFIRLGTKVPVTMPQRISEDRELLETLREVSTKEKRVFVSTQFNHPRELTPAARRAVTKLQRSGVVTNNQTVLLRGVNDDPTVLADLQGSLTGCGIIPYYVFQCRPVKRVKKLFQVPLLEGSGIVERAKAMLDGYSKRFRYVMSHRDGKISLAGTDDRYFYLRFHQARDPHNSGRFFRRRIDPAACWLDELERV